MIANLIKNEQRNMYLIKDKDKIIYIYENVLSSSVDRSAI